MAMDINAMVEVCHGRSVKAGWYTNLETGKPIPVTMELKLAKIALIHSEISEALEGLRKNIKDDHLPHREMAEVELADATIRIFDLAGLLNYDLGGAFVEKLLYNQNRADHKPGHRKAVGGKAL